MKKFLLPFILGVLFLAAPGGVRAEIILVSYMTGANEVPPTNSPGTGISVVSLSDDMTSIDYYVAFENLVSNATVSHIHVGSTTEAGPIILNFHGIPSHTSGTFGGTLTPNDFMPGGGLATYRDAIHALLTGGEYTNLHSGTFPAGEIRGQLYIFQP
jgi:hypothetical protein